MKFNIIANGVPLPMSAVLSGNVLYYDLEEALIAVEKDISQKTTVAEGYHVLVQQRDLLRSILTKARSAS